MSQPPDTIPHRWFEEVWNKGRAEAIDELLDPGAVGHGLVDESGAEVCGIEAFKGFYHSFRRTFSDIRVTVEDAFADGDKVVGRCRVNATHSGEGFGLAPTQKPVEFTGMCIMRVKDGKIVEAWNNFDFLTMMQQMK